MQSLGVIQVALQWLMFSIIVILAVIYFPPPPPPRSNEQPHEHHHHIPRPSEILHSEYTPPTYRAAVSVAAANTVYFTLGAMISIVFLARSAVQARTWAAWLGVISMVLATMQYIPQLWVTWRIKVPPLPGNRISLIVASCFIIYTDDVHSVAGILPFCVFTRYKTRNKLVELDHIRVYGNFTSHTTCDVYCMESKGKERR